MKKIAIVLFTSFCCLLNLNTTLAVNNIKKVQYIEEKFNDGYYIETVIEEVPTNTRANVKNGSKTSTFKDSEGTIIWSVKVSGSFTYNGSFATCTSSSISTTCPATNWKLSNKKAYTSGSTAIASVTAKEYTFLGICTKTIEKTVKLTCNPDGTLS